MDRARVISSAYSSSPPKEIPRAIVVTFTGKAVSFFCMIIYGGIPLNIGVKGKDDFCNFFFLDTVHKGIDRKLVGTDPVERGYDTPENMIGSAELLGGFNGNHIADGFHHTDHIFPAHGIGTDGTDIGISHIMTAVQNRISCRILSNGFPEARAADRILLQ